MRPLSPSGPAGGRSAPSPAILIALSLLRTARDKAIEMQLDPKEFALRLSALFAAGLNETDVRWLLAGGLVEQAQERRRPDAGRRSFRHMANLALEHFQFHSDVVRASRLHNRRCRRDARTTMKLKML